MSVQYSPVPHSWITVPSDADAGWATRAASDFAPRAGWLAPVLEEAAAGATDGEDRLVLVDTTGERAVVVDLDILNLGMDVPDPADLMDGSTATTEEFTAGFVQGTRTVWVSTAPAGVDAGEDALQAQALYVGTLTGTGYLITLRTAALPLDSVVSALPRCEELLSTMRA